MNAITVSEYFAAPGLQDTAIPQAHRENADELIEAVNMLLNDPDCPVLKINPRTKTYISGTTGGGYRTPALNDFPGGRRSTSKHLIGCAIDLYDPIGGLDAWITDEILIRYGLYREHPDATHGWCHLQTTPVLSGRRTFWP